jgi:hypothetical protein
MPLMLLSNPGLHLALLGNPRRRSKKRFGFGSRKRFTQARWRAKRRVGRRFRIKGGGSYRVRSANVRKHRARGKRHLTGISWSGRLGGVSYRGAIRRRGARKYRSAAWTNPRRRRRSHRKNPMRAFSGYVSALKKSPKEVLGVFKGPKKIKHIAFAAGGALGTYMAGGVFTARVLTPALARFPAVAGVMANPIASRVIGGLIPFTLGFVASKFIKGEIGKALLVGGGLASIVEIAKPGMIGQLMHTTPVVSAVAAPVAAAAGAGASAGPVHGMLGLGAYVDSPAYQGVGAYVDSPAYQGVGDAEDDAGDDEMAGIGAADDLAGVDGYLEQGSDYLNSYLN